MLSPHFKLIEFTRSATARRHGICNEAPVSVITNLQNLCQRILEPLRASINRPFIRDGISFPILISSGYRCTQLNHLVGGVKNSNHLTGHAADIYPSERHIAWYQREHADEDLSNSEARDAILMDWFYYIRQHLQPRELLLERSALTTWLHVAY